MASELQQKSGAWLRIWMARVRGALQPPLALVGLARPDERAAE
jgi:hypothetical protein